MADKLLELSVSLQQESEELRRLAMATVSSASSSTFPSSTSSDYSSGDGSGVRGMMIRSRRKHGSGHASASTPYMRNLRLTSPPANPTSTTSPAELLQKAELLRKKVKSGRSTKGKGKCDEDDIIRLTVCAMQKTSHSLFAHSGPYVEVVARKGDCYKRLVQTAKRAIGLQPGAGNEALTLFKASGAILLDDDIITGSTKTWRPWTIGNYLAFIAKKTASQVKFGVGYVTIPETEVEQERKDEISGQDPSLLSDQSRQGLVVKYRPVDFDRDGGIIPGVQMERQQVWDFTSQGEFGTIMDTLVPYQPEDDDYVVTSIEKDGQPLLGSCYVDSRLTIDVTTVTTSTDFSIAHQSPTNVVVQSFWEAIALYCITTRHVATHYRWAKVGEPRVEFPATPVIFVKDVGLYQCHVRCGGEELQSLVMSVSVQPAQDLPSILLCGETLPESSSESVPELAGEIELGTGPSHVQSGSGPSGTQSLANCSLLEFEGAELRTATDSFSKGLIGQGGFGKVYRAQVRGATTVAVKVLHTEGSSTEGGLSMLKVELSALSRYRHQNLVDLLGFCMNPPALIFEFMEEGSLYDHLHSEDRHNLNWQRRCHILKDACRGLTWLHESSTPMVHQDVKTANILIDKNYNGKVGDFGFCLEIPQVDRGRTHVTAPMFARTEGYYAPELTHGELSTKSDVYSYGVVVLETYSGLLAYVQKATAERKDKKLVAHLEDHTKDFAMFKEVRDLNSVDELAPYVQKLLFDIVSRCLVRLSKRPSSTEIMKLWNQTNF